MSHFHLIFMLILKNIFALLKNVNHSDHDLKKFSLPNLRMSKQPVNYSKYSTRCNDYQNFQSKYENLSKTCNIYYHPDLTAVTEIIKDRFYFATLLPGRKEPKSLTNVYLFAIDDELVYNNFYNDFGPLNIACLYKYCLGVNQILHNPEHKGEIIVHFTSIDADKRANAAYLVASYAMLYLNKTPLQACNAIMSKDLPPFKDFQDASPGVSNYTITIIDCLNALYKAAALGFFDMTDFNVKEYERYEQLKNGDMNWIVPRKFLAFIGPNTERGVNMHYPEKYLNYFMKNNVAAVIRLNRQTYEPFRFTNAGILHYDMFFPDGSTPPKKILRQFLQVAESTRGAIAIHCKAGLGRTGTLIAAYIMKHYRMTAREAIAWLRICRPGSVIGSQQTWLQEMENSLWREGRYYRLKYHGDQNLVLHHKRGIYSLASKFDKKVRFRDYLNKEKLMRSRSEKLNTELMDTISSNVTLGCTSTCENYLNYSNTKLSQEGGVDIKDIDIMTTQGDKLNEIKIMRELLSNDLYFGPTMTCSSTHLP